MQHTMPISATAPASADTVSLFPPTALDVDRFQSAVGLVDGGRTFGGRLVSEATLCAAATVDPSFHPHSAHAQFLRPGDTGKPMVYEVEHLRDGRSFCSRLVRATQDGALICMVTVSLGVEREGLDRQQAMPAVAGPETLPDEAIARRKLAETDALIERTFRGREHPVEFRLIDVPASRQDSDGRLKVWFRGKPQFMTRDTAVGRAALLAYASDRFVMTSSITPHFGQLGEKEFAVASLDHALWIHRDFAPESWLLHSIESVTTSGSRTFIRGQIFAENGDHIASTSQEGWLGVKARVAASQP